MNIKSFFGEINFDEAGWALQKLETNPKIDSFTKITPQVAGPCLIATMDLIAKYYGSPVNHFLVEFAKKLADQIPGDVDTVFDSKRCVSVDTVYRM